MMHMLLNIYSHQITHTIELSQSLIHKLFKLNVFVCLFIPSNSQTKYNKNIMIMHMTRIAIKNYARFSSSYPSNLNLKSSQSTFHANELQLQLNKQARTLPSFKGITFGKYNSDHMIEIDYNRKEGWRKPKIAPFQNLSLHPFSSSLHYGIQCFDGLKGYKNQKGEIRLFRPDCNAFRLKQSSKRLTLPDFDGNQLIKLIKELLIIDQRWIPTDSGSSLYIRPLHIATDQTLGIHTPEGSKLFVMTGPVGSYYSTGFKPISLSCATDTIRSAPKGTGSYKIGGNYSPTILASNKVEEKGYQQILWLLNQKVIEVGSSNIFFVFKDSQTGEIQVATPCLQDLILPGVTRDSILKIIQSENKYKVTQREIYIQQVLKRHKNGQLLECFGTGTAVVVSGIEKIQYKGEVINIPVDSQNSIGMKARRKLLGIQQGSIPDPFGWIYRVK